MNNRENRLKNKWTEQQWQVGHYQAVKLCVIGISEEEEIHSGAEKTSEELMDKKIIKIDEKYLQLRNAQTFVNLT